MNRLICASGGGDMRYWNIVDANEFASFKPEIGDGDDVIGFDEFVRYVDGT